MKFDKGYWNDRWSNGLTGWDVGGPSTRLKEYFDQIEDKEMKVLIPGCGNAWEAEYLHELGFTNVFLIDIADLALKSFHQRFPAFPESHLINEDFFEHNRQYDLIVEQTFFCALDPKMRAEYRDHMHELLKPDAKLIGLLFNDKLNTEHPPFGGSKPEYDKLFKEKFDIKCLETAYNSIKPRAERELFIIFEKSHNA